MLNGLADQHTIKGISMPPVGGTYCWAAEPRSLQCIINHSCWYPAPIQSVCLALISAFCDETLPKSGDAAMDSHS